MGGAGDGNRTRIASLEGWGSTIELRPHAPPKRRRPKRTGMRLVVGRERWLTRDPCRRVGCAGHQWCTGVWRSLVAHSLWERGAVGSNPATPTRRSTSESRLTPVEAGLWLSMGRGPLGRSISSHVPLSLSGPLVWLVADMRRRW